ncbi:hypothetical protein M422DRAFT_47042 [Sphaerobolus stellatus SS14]|uniref:Uncharacterized protein n=1 Tax=Sphaerobolus stellatus (strain SS14) TaxID=990650 RepID=A0A0C9W2J5_SPHS4|nr:hypothetical protein M422DRAFT_47042 [Sphaerobolus stellatus SS14]
MTRENTLLFLQVQICIIPLTLTRIYRHNQSVNDLAWALLDNLEQCPLEFRDISLLQGDQEASDFNFSGAPVDTPNVAIIEIAHELAYSSCPSQHSWLGICLLRIVELTLRLRSLTNGEFDAIMELAARRAVNLKGKVNPKIDEILPWEVALFALCAKKNPDFIQPVLHSSGLPCLYLAFQTMLNVDVSVKDMDWENIVLILRSFAFLSELEWLCATDLMGESVVKALIKVLRWFPVRYWATDTLRNILAHCPDLAHIFLDSDITSPVSFILPPEIPLLQLDYEDPEPLRKIPTRRQTLWSAFSPGTSQRKKDSQASRDRRLSVGSSSSGITNSRLYTYFYEATKRANELEEYVKTWRRGSLLVLPELTPVLETEAWHTSLMFVGYDDVPVP